MSTLERAIAIAASAHAGQVDKAGQPYILHPLRVMLALTTPEERVVGVLHDVVEDTDITITDLQNEGFSETVIEAIRAVTKLPGEKRMEAAARAAQNSLAIQVKLADNADNMDLSRIAHPGPADFARLEEYQQVRCFLLSQIKA